ncbi:MAG: Uma2 family endonuclease [Archangium sp.]|nr:Uma2 family endonuclease [Archangium sp.]
MNEVIELLDERTRPLKVTEYVALAELGVFDEERVELLRGRVVKMSPQGEEHSFVMGSLTNLLVEHFGKWATVRPGLPINASEDSMPEPDFALIPRQHAPAPHPSKALLLIEVSNTSLRLDRVVKAPLYAEGGSLEYWIIDVQNAQLEVFRKPVKGEWTEQFTLGANDSIRPVSFPDVEFALAPVLLALRH